MQSDDTDIDRAFLADAVAREEVNFALLFGSRGKGEARADSDWDVAIHLPVGLDSDARRAVRDRLIASLEPKLRVDVVILNDAPALLGHRALLGEVLVMRDRTAYTRYFVRTLGAAGDEAWWRQLHARERERRLREGSFGRS